MGAAAMTVQEVAVYLNVDAKTVYPLVHRGDLPGFKVALGRSCPPKDGGP